MSGLWPDIDPDIESIDYGSIDEVSKDKEKLDDQ